jgi:putative membrane-bound dehydrogenase-like protein
MFSNSGDFLVMSIVRFLTVLAIVAATLAHAADAPRAPHVFFLISEPEYDTKTTLPAFAKTELEPRGIRCTFSIASPDRPDEFPGLEALKDADLLFVSVRRQAPPAAQMDLIRAHVVARKPVVGIRTASHAFALRGNDAKVPPGHADWPEFDHEVLGGNYHDHYGAGIPTFAKILPEAAGHPVLAGIDGAEFELKSHLYKNPDLPAHVTKLLTGRMEGRPEVEPIAWVNTANDRRVFYTSLGAPQDFEIPQFRRLLLNGIFWALGKPPPTAKEGAALTPAESAKAFTVAADLQIDLMLAEPQIAQPVFLNFDERGRMWVVEYRQYPNPAGLKAVSTDAFYRTVYDKVPLPPPRGDKGADRISIHEDTDGDGTFDKHTVFVDGLNICTAVEHGRGGHFVLNPPYLLFYPDANGDDVPDSDPQVLLAGFGLEDTHSVANSLRWGPDGWLYGAHGSTVTSHITRPDLDKEPIAHMIGQGIWRYHPETRRFEVFAEGGGNTFGVEFDAQGRLFSGHNGGDTRGFHYMQGAYLRKGFEKHGQLSNPYAFGFYEPMQHNKAERFSHNFIIYEGGALTEKYEGKIFAIEPLQGRVMLAERIVEGSTFRTRDLGPVVTTTDRWFRPVDIKAGPDGAIYICDLYERAISHIESEKGNTDPTNGRVWRVKWKMPTPPQPARELSLEEKEEEELKAARAARRIANLPITGSPSAGPAFWSRNKWFRQTALRVMLDEIIPAHAATQARLDALPKEVIPICPPLEAVSYFEMSRVPPDQRDDLEPAQHELELFWLGAAGFDLPRYSPLNRFQKFGRESVREILTSSDPILRSWAARLICDSKTVSGEFAAELLGISKREENIEVRLQLAASARRLPAAQCLPIVRELLHRDEDATDSRQPLMLWWAIESKCANDRDAVLKLFEESPLWDRPLVRDFIFERVMRRFAASGTRAELLACARLLDLAPSVEHARKLMTGFEAAFQGRSLAGLPDELVQAMARRKVGSAALSVRLGDEEATSRALKTLADPKADAGERQRFAQVLGEVKVKEAAPVLLDVATTASDDSLRQTALGALAVYDDATISDRVVAAYANFSSASQHAAQTLLASRKNWASQLARAVEAGRISRDSIGPDIIAKLRQLNDGDLSSVVTKLWPSTKPASAEVQQTIARLASVVRSGAGDPYRGRTLFLASCSGCHRLHNVGGQIGPDLTPFKRDDLESLLRSIVDPNAEIREGYENVLVTAKDGRVLNGFLVEQNPQSIMLRGLNGENLALERAAIAELKPAGVSLMPEGLLAPFDDQQVRDFFAYLRTGQPLVVK